MEGRDEEFFVPEGFKREETMKKALMLGAALIALATAAPAQAELKFKPGEDARFTWSNYCLLYTSPSPRDS